MTGGASGIGAACVRRLARLGATVVILDVDLESGQALQAELGAPHLYRSLDVSDPAAWKTVLDEVEDLLGRVDILHLNAGVMSRPRGAPLLDDPLKWFTQDAYRKVRGVNLDGVVYGIEAVLGRGGCSRIVLTASGAAVSPLAMDPFYTATKHAELGLGLALAPTLAEKGMRIDVICPGAVDTPITAPDIRAMPLKQESPEFIASALEQILASPNAPNHAWLAYSEKEGVRAYVPTGAQAALDVVDRQ